MTNSVDITDASRRAGSVERNPGRPKVRFQGIVEPEEPAETAEFGSFEAWAASTTDGAAFRNSRFGRMGVQLERWARYVAFLIFFAVLVGWPLGSWWAHRTLTGHWSGWTLADGFSYGAIAFAVVVPPVLIVFAHLASRMTTMMDAAQAIAAAAQQLIRPDQAAIDNVQTVGAVVRGQMEALNTGIDDALIRLASAEAMIRQHVSAIEQAGAAVETRTTSAAERVAAERARLIDLTETLNARADDFATAIAEKAQANIEALQNTDGAASAAEERLDDRLARLEAAAQRALMSFEALSTALGDADEHMRTTSGSIEASANDVKRVSEVAAKIADAAAESAARNAANIGMFSNQAAERARKAAEDAIETARSEAERASDAAVEFTTREAKRVTEAAAKAVEDVQAATRSAVESAASNAERASSAAHLVTEAARLATTAAQDASQQVQKASAFAKKSADDAMGVAEASAARVEARNKELAAARASLEAENARLESLIDEQRRRADRLAEAIATQTERLSKLAENQLREQEAAARLAEAQAAIQKTRSADLDRASKAEAERAARAQKEAEAARAAKAEAEAATKREADEKERAKPRAAAPRRAENPPSNILELDGGARKRAAIRPSGGGVADRLDDLAAEISGGKDQRRSDDRPTTDDRRKKDGVSWREILSATDDAEPLDLGAAGKRSEPSRPDAERAAANAAMKIIANLQAFTLDLEMRLYGEPPVTLLERFERGDRNVFANRILRLNEADVKRRIRAESARDKSFEKGIHNFLQGFERLLEDATTSATADEELEEYLSSPLGRVYLLVGATVGYFA